MKKNAVLPSLIKIETEWTHIAKVWQTRTKEFMEGIFLKSSLSFELLKSDQENDLGH